MSEYHWLEFPNGVPMERWGKDHHSTLLYAESRAVDHGGKLRAANMRVDVRYPTRLTNGDTVIRHTDYMCLLDAQTAGLLSQVPEEGDEQTPVIFTDKGLEYCAALRKNRHDHLTSTYAKVAQNWGREND